MQTMDTGIVRRPRAETVVVLTTEPLPLPGGRTSGAGLRAWGLAEGLRSRGFNVVVACPAVAGAPEVVSDNPMFAHAHTFRRDAIGEFLEREKPDVVVLQHWGLAAEVPELSVPFAIDMFGPHLLERLYWGGSNFERNFAEKLAALRRADFLTCSGVVQRPYFYPIMAQAGYDLKKDTLPVIPLSVPPPGWEERAYPDRTGEAKARIPDSFVYGGAFLAWQDPDKAILWLLDEMDRAGRGRLYFHCGAHPVIDASGGKFAAIVEKIAGHPRVETRGFLEFDKSLKTYRGYSVALDLMGRNPERELAFTTRTMFHFYAGLPVIYNDYSEISSIIRERNCGWAVSPDDEAQVRGVFRSILAGESPVEEMRRNATQVASDYSWDNTITPLAEFCEAPYFRPGKTATMLAVESDMRELERLRAERDGLRGELDTIRGKLLFRLQKKLPSLAAALAPVAWLLAWPLALRLWWSLKPGTAPGRRQ